MLEAELAAEHSLDPDVQRLLGDYAGVRRYDMLESERARPRRAPGSPLLGSTASAELSQVRLLPEEVGRPGASLPRGAPRPGPAAGRPPRPQLVAVPARRGVDGRAARDAARQRRRAVRPQRAPEAAAAAHGRPRQAHRQRVGGRGAVLPALQDHPPPAHEHGEGGAEHDDAHRRRPTTTATAST